MEYDRWELHNWRTETHGRDLSIFTTTKKVASYMWQSWTRGATVVLVLVFLPILFPLALFLSFVGFISAVPLLCGATACYLISRSFSLPACISGLFTPNRPSEVLREVESVSKTTFTVAHKGTEDPGRVSDAKAILLLGCDLVVKERDEAESREHRRPMKGNRRKSESGPESSSSEMCHSNTVLQVRGPIFILPSAKLKGQYEQRKDKGTWSVDGTKGGSMAEALKREGCDASRDEPSKTSLEDRICDGVTCRGSSMVEGYEEYSNAESVFIQHTVTVAPTAESRETSGHLRMHDNGKDCPAGNRALTGELEVITEASVDSTSHTIPARYWRDEVEDTVLSTATANMAYMENRSLRGSGDMASLMSWNTESEKMMMDDHDDISLLEVFSASQTPYSEQYKDKVVEGEKGRINLSPRFATSLFSHQRRLSFSNVLADDEILSPRFFLPRAKFNDFTPDCKKRCVSTSFSDYTWPSESSEQGFEFLSTRGTTYEDSVDTDSSVAQCGQENDLEPGVVADSTFVSASAQLTEDWEARRKTWEEESTLGRLAPLSPYMEAHSVEARSMCNPLFEFSSPSPPLKKLKYTGGKNDISNSPPFHTRFSRRLSAPPKIQRTQTWSSSLSLSPRRFKIQECKSGLSTERLEPRRDARSYSASFTDNLEPYSGEFESL